MKCFCCGATYKSPVANDSFRELFSSFGQEGVANAEKVGGDYCAGKQGWKQDAAGNWACPDCIASKGLR